MEKYPPSVDPAVEEAAAGSSEGVEEAEESGWTDYLEDFSSEIDRRSSFCSSIGSSSSIVSDAAALKSRNANLVLPFSSVGEVVEAPKKLRFKKTRTQKIFEDDSLEDTATSPVHSPKVAELGVRPSDVNPRFDHMMITSSLGSERLSENYYPDLKKRGLCLYPLSMLLNYNHGS